MLPIPAFLHWLCHSILRDSATNHLRLLTGLPLGIAYPLYVKHLFLQPSAFAYIGASSFLTIYLVAVLLARKRSSPNFR